MSETEGWTLETLRVHLLALIDEKDRRYAAEQQGLRASVDAVKDGIGIALAAAKEAVAKAETAAEKRFEGVNEFRAQLGDQQRTLMPRAEVEVLLNALGERLGKLETQITNLSGQSTGKVAGWAWLAGVIALVMTVVTAVLMFQR